MSTGRRWRPSLHCHLGLCLSLRCDFTLEPFNRGLASEGADQHAQRFVAVIARRTLTCCASTPLIALVSRTDHNAATPSVSLMFAPELSTSAIALCGHHAMARRRAEPQARSSPPARKGRSEAEWLDRAEDRRTIRRCDGRSVCPPGSQRENPRDERDAQVGSQAGGDGQATISGMDSVRVRVHLYERCFRRKPVRRVPADEVHVGVTHDTGRALADVTDEARFCRTTATWMWGVSDPRKTRSGTVIGGWQRGSLTPQMPPSQLPTPALVATRAAQGAARCNAAKSYGVKDMVESVWRATTLTPSRVGGEHDATEGERCSRVCVPPCLR
jgi:hypothetical protein